MTIPKNRWQVHVLHFAFYVELLIDAKGKLLDVESKNVEYVKLTQKQLISNEKMDLGFVLTLYPPFI